MKESNRHIRIQVFFILMICIGFLYQACTIYDKNEPLAMAEYKKIIPGEPFDPNVLKRCRIVAKGRIDKIDINMEYNNKPIFQKRIVENVLYNIKDHVISCEKYAEMVYDFLNEIWIPDYINLLDGFVDKRWLEGATVYIVRIANKPRCYPDIIAWFPVVGEGEHYAFFIVSKKGYVLCKHDAEVAEYVIFNKEYLKIINRLGLFILPWDAVQFGDGNILPSKRNYMECIIGRDAFSLDDIYFSPRCSNRIRIDNGYKPLPEGWHDLVPDLNK